MSAVFETGSKCFKHNIHSRWKSHSRSNVKLMTHSGLLELLYLELLRLKLEHARDIAAMLTEAWSVLYYRKVIDTQNQRTLVLLTTCGKLVQGSERLTKDKPGSMRIFVIKFIFLWIEFVIYLRYFGINGYIGFLNFFCNTGQTSLKWKIYVVIRVLSIHRMMFNLNQWLKFFLDWLIPNILTFYPTTLVLPEWRRKDRSSFTCSIAILCYG